jgi:hypothetical protein
MSIPGFQAEAAVGVSASYHGAPWMYAAVREGGRGTLLLASGECGYGYYCCQYVHDCRYDVYPCGSQLDGTVIWCQQLVCDTICQQCCFGGIYDV